MNLKAKLAQIDEKNSKAKNDNKNTSQVLWLEKVYGKNTKFASAKVYSK